MTEIEIRKTVETIEKLYQENKNSYSRQDIIEIASITILQDISEKLEKLNELKGISNGTHGIWGEMRSKY